MICRALLGWFACCVVLPANAQDLAVINAQFFVESDLCAIALRGADPNASDWLVIDADRRVAEFLRTPTGIQIKGKGRHIVTGKTWTWNADEQRIDFWSETIIVYIGGTPGPPGPDDDDDDTGDDDDDDGPLPDIPNKYEIGEDIYRATLKIKDTGNVRRCLTDIRTQAGKLYPNEEITVKLAVAQLKATWLSTWETADWQQWRATYKESAEGVRRSIPQWQGWFLEIARAMELAIESRQRPRQVVRRRTNNSARIADNISIKIAP